MDRLQQYHLLAHAAPGREGKGQDAAFCAEQDGVYAIAVGDGITQAGQYAGIGAAIATRAAVQFLLDWFDTIVDAEEDRLRGILYDYFYLYFTQDLDRYARKWDLPPVLETPEGFFHSDFVSRCSYSTTLIACAVKGDQVIAIKIGNGVIAADTGNGFGIVSPSSLPGAATPSLELLINPSFPSFSFKRYLVKDLRAIILMSDGPEVTVPKLFRKNSRYLEPAFEEWLARAIRSEDSFCEQVEDLGTRGPDDVSAAILWRDLQDIRLAEGEDDPFEGHSLYVKRSEVEDVTGKDDDNVWVPVEDTVTKDKDECPEGPVIFIGTDDTFPEDPFPADKDGLSGEDAVFLETDRTVTEDTSPMVIDRPTEDVPSLTEEQESVETEKTAPVLTLPRRVIRKRGIGRAVRTVDKDRSDGNDGGEVQDGQLFPGNFWKTALLNDPSLAKAISRYNDDFPLDETMEPACRRELWERIFSFCLDLVLIEERRKLKDKEKSVYEAIKKSYRDLIDDKQDKVLRILRLKLDEAEKLSRAALSDNGRRSVHVSVNYRGVGRFVALLHPSKRPRG